MSDNTTPEAIKRDFGKAPAQSSSLGGLFTFLLVVALAGGLGFVVWQQQQRLDAMNENYQAMSSAAASINTLEQGQQQVVKTQQMQDQQVIQLGQAQQVQLSTQQQAQAGFQQQLQLALNTVNEQTGQIKKLTDEVTVLRNKVADVGAAALRSQILAEAAGLLRLADQRLQVAQDVDSTIVLVRNSDLLLSKLTDAAVGSLRNQLANDLSALQAAQKNDAHQVHQQLGEAVAQLAMLMPVSKTSVNNPELKPNADTSAADAGWFDRAAGFLRQYFVITRRDTPVTPLLTPEQSWLIRKSIELQLQQARSAALNGDAVLYKLSVIEAEAAINEALQGEGKDELLKKLKTLETAAIRSNLPSLAPALAAIQQLQAPGSKAGTP